MALGAEYEGRVGGVNGGGRRLVYSVCGYPTRGRRRGGFSFVSRVLDGTCEVERVPCVFGR